jgi:hypothetical protein
MEPTTTQTTQVFVRLANAQTGPNAMPVTETEILQTLRAIVLSYWPKRKNDYFPGPQPVSLERRDLFKLRKFPYLACVKSNGMRFMMLCSTINEQNKCYMIDRAFRFYEVEQCFDKAIYTNTLFDGELVFLTDKKLWTYVIHDCISFRGNDVSQKNFNQRYSHVTTVIETFWDYVEPENNNDEKLSLFPIEIKKFIEFSKLNDLVEMEKNGEISHPTDGIIFTPIGLPIGSNAQYTLFKWKPLELHTFDFKITYNDGKYTAMVNKKGNLIPFASVDQDLPQGVKFKEKLEAIENPSYESGAIVECEYDTKDQCFNPKLIRTDKTHPNGLYTVEKTLLNIQEDISIKELTNLKLF